MKMVQFSKGIKSNHIFYLNFYSEKIKMYLRVRKTNNKGLDNLKNI